MKIEYLYTDETTTIKNVFYHDQLLYTVIYLLDSKTKKVLKSVRVFHQSGNIATQE